MNSTMATDIEIQYWNYTLDPNNAMYPAVQGLEWTWALTLKSIIFTTIILFTVLGNLLVLVSIGLNQNLRRSPTHAFIGNLALADLLVGLLVLPCNATVQITGKWYFGLTYCVTWACIHLWLCSTSILSICAICLDRYIGVSRPLKHFKVMQGRVVGGLIGAVWALAFCLGALPVFVWPEPQNGGPFSCKFNSSLGLVMVVTVGIFYIPMGLMVILYWKIYRAAVRHLDSVRAGRVRTKSAGSVTSLRIHVGGSKNLEDGRTNDGSPSSASTENLLSVNFGRQAQAARKLIVVVVAFVICYCPFFTVFFFSSIYPGSVSEEAFNVFGWLRYFNSCLNPIMYAAMLPAFRAAFKKIICFWK